MKKRGIIVILLVLICVVYLVITNTNNKPKKKQPKKKVVEKISSELKKELKNKFTFITSNGYCELDNKFINGCLYSKKKIKKEELSTKYRIFSILMQIEEKEEIKTTKKFKDQEYEINYKVDSNKIKEIYNSIYNDNNYQPQEINNIEDEPKIIYENNTFYYIKQKNVEANHVITYINKYEKKKNHMYLYVSTAFVNLVQNQKRKITNYEIYEDYKTINLKEEGSYDEYKDKKGKIVFKLNKENYKTYDEYKISFVKENEKYYFEKIELLD